MSLPGAALAAPRRLRLPARFLATATVSYLAISIVLFSRFLGNLGQAVPGGPDDLLYAWYFEWVEHALTHGENLFLSPALNAPTGVNVMWNTSMLLVAVICVPLTATIGPFATVVLVAVVAPVASAATMCYVLRRLTGNRAGSYLGGLLLGFGPFAAGQNGHMHLSLAVYAPLLLLFGHELIVTQDTKPIRTGVALGVATGLGLLTTQEVVAISGITALIAVIFLAMVWPGEIESRWRHAAIGFGVAAGIAFAMDAIPLYYQFIGPLHLSGVVVGDQRIDMAGLLRPSGLQYLARRSDIAANVRYPANGIENTGYLGLPLIAVCIAIVIWLARHRDRLASWWLATVAVTIVLSLGTPIAFDGHRIGRGPWKAFAQLPLFGGVVPARISLATTVLVAYLIAIATARLSGRASAIGLAVLIVALLPLLPSGRYGEDAPTATPRFFTTSAVDTIARGSNVVILPSDSTPHSQAMAMTWQAKAHLRFHLIGGYSVFNLSGHMTYLPPPPALTTALTLAGQSTPTSTPPTLAAVQKSIVDYRIRYVLISARQANADRVADAAAQLTGCTPRTVADMTVCEIPSSLSR